MSPPSVSTHRDTTGSPTVQSAFVPRLNSNVAVSELPPAKRRKKGSKSNSIVTG